MSKYSNQQEHRMNRLFKEHPDVELLEFYGGREKNSGDFLIQIGKHKIRVDHKSTIKKNSIRLMKDWLPTLTYYTQHRMKRDGKTLPLITLTMSGHKTIWVLGYTIFQELEITNEARIRPGCKEITLKTGWFYDIKEGLGKISFDDYTAYVMELENFIRRIKDV